MPLPLYLLAMAVFAMGTSEFMLAGLLPDIASDLDVTVGTAGALTSAFALGMVVGAPLVAALARNWPRRSSLLGFILAFAAAHAVGALTTSFPVLFATRVVAALANAGFLAVALTTAAMLVSPGRKGRALAVLLSGTTVATVAGVPGGSVLGTVLGWRAAFWAVAALCLPAALGILKAIPAGPVEEEATGGPALRAELARLTRPPLMLVMLLGALVNAATFGSFTFLAPVVTGTAGLGELWISVVLVLFGAGSFAGVTVAGRLSDQRPGLVLAVGGPLLLIGWPALAVLADEPLALLVLVFVQGALSFALGSTLITRVLYEAAGAPTMAGSYATAALNVGAAAGPLIAAATLSTPAGNLGPLWASGFLVAITLLIAFPLRTVVTAGRSAEALQ
ncbi:Cmx/CmrA family chloramphenicol efflux MFS transporter [Streptomyces griseomycini]|uniref:DHA1 family chloramphenicol resistance protein-like MFS transporter n=1 Tax=Streptomyces griseomycini TaxID=66895 RepID=A0A7W7LZ88_9ACTN|nr:Cmx/CmrA family chloramphenicol efflux MFS transporter [Streptomyces griseomycini]MBB4899199.1 DHA1 family chloramphenicol resistance protein-like MFS transporter [Streptomyces griseomycini]GGQ05277.1 chloramphenicol resistance protein [Streptomyces griseomycini]GGR20561.1 chloramphenicol resistance protein [Streptomyces griseomycini]